MKLRDFELECYFDRYEFTAPYLLAQSDCESVTVRELLDMEPGAAEGFLKLRLGYTETWGDPALRQSVASLCGFPGRPENALLLHGAQEGIFLLLNTLLDSGDHLIAMYPNYPSVFEIAAAIPGLACSRWELRDTGRGWAPDFDELKALIRPETKLIAVNSPNNPTGYTLTNRELEWLCGVCRERGIYLFCDEVYKGLELDGESRVWAAELYERAVSLGVMSKSYGLPGLRLGWAVSRDRGVLERMERMKHYTSLCDAAPSEYLSGVALRHGQRLLDRSLEIIRANLAAADRFFEKFAHVFEKKDVAAGPVAFHRLLLPQGVDRFCRQAVDKKGVLLLPGRVYGTDGPYFRMGYGRKSFPENLKKLEEFLIDEGYGG